MLQQRKYQKLVVWQKAMSFVTEVYRVTRTFPGDERFGLTSQMRRAAISVPSNIAEGAGRGSDREFIRFLQIAKGSLFELETQIGICQRLGLLTEAQDLLKRVDHQAAMITNLIESLNSKT